MTTEFATVRARTDEGEDLPVIDVTNPAFTINFTDQELAALLAKHLEEDTGAGEMSVAKKVALFASRLGRGLMKSSGTYLTGMNTYLLKAGPMVFGADANPIDRLIAATFPALAVRLRLQDMARLLAEGLVTELTADRSRPIQLINIAGGPAPDSWNALIQLNADQPGLLAGRSIEIIVLDVDDEGPSFGARAVDALRAPGAPLAGLEIAVRHIRYSWSDADRLRGLLVDFHSTDAICAVSSEGGLFEYGSDAEIITNLTALRDGTPPETVIVGSVTREPGSKGGQIAAVRPHTIEEFRDLAKASGWRLERVIERPFSYNVRLCAARGEG